MLLDSRSRRYGVSGGADGGPGASPAGEGRRKWGHHHLLLIASHTPSTGMREYSKGKRGQLNMFRLPDSCVLWLSLTVSPRICQPSRLRGNNSILVCAATTVRQRAPVWPTAAISVHTYHVMKPQLFQDHHRSRACDGPIGGEREHTHHTRVRRTDSGLKRLILDLVCVCVCVCAPKNSRNWSLKSEWFTL